MTLIISSSSAGNLLRVNNLELIDSARSNTFNPPLFVPLPDLVL